MKTIPVLTFTEFATKYCERQEQTIDGLRAVLLNQKSRFNPEGWFMLQCEMMDSSLLGSLTILPYGPNNTHKVPPAGPISPRGSCSDMSMPCAILLANNMV